MVHSITTDKGEVEMPKTETAPEFDADFTQLIERIKVKAIAGEDTAELVKEAKSVKDAWKGESGPTTNKGRKAMLAAIEEAAAAKPAALEGTVQTSAEVALADTQEVGDIEGGEELFSTATEKFVSGVRLHLKASDTAAEIADVVVDLRSRSLYKGKPDMLANGPAARKFKSAILEASAEAAKTDGADVDDVEAAIRKLGKAIDNAMSHAMVTYVRELKPGTPEAERFAAIAEAHPELSLSEAVRAEYGIAEKSKRELDREKSARLRELAAAGSEPEEDVEPKPAADHETPKDFVEVEKIEKAAAKIGKQPGQLEDDELETLKKKIDAMTKKLIKLSDVFEDEMKRRAAEEA